MKRRHLAVAAVLVLSGCGAAEKPVVTASVIPLPEVPKSTSELLTSTTSAAPSTTTTEPVSVTPHSAPQEATRGVPRTRPSTPSTASQAPTGGRIRRVSSTAYCDRGVMANGRTTHAGAVAMNGVAFGSRWRVIETGAVYTVEDRIGHGSEFDIWMPSCSAAVGYGRRSITVQEVG